MHYIGEIALSEHITRQDSTWGDVTNPWFIMLKISVLNNTTGVHSLNRWKKMFLSGGH